MASTAGESVLDAILRGWVEGKGATGIHEIFTCLHPQALGFPVDVPLMLDS